MPVVKVTKSNFNSLSESDKTVLLDFYANWCGPCRMVSPILEEIANENDDIIIGKINVDDEPELSQAFGVVSIPLLVVMRDGMIIDKAVGARPKSEILEMLE